MVDVLANGHPVVQGLQEMMVRFELRELTIAGMLGHRVKGITARYATAPDSALLAAADRVSARLAAALANQWRKP